MIKDVTFEKTEYQPSPAKFEAGTGNIADAVGLGAALDYLSKIGMPNISRYEHERLEYGTQSLLSVPGLRLIGTAANKASVLSFVMPGKATEEIGTYLNQHGLAVRAGHHCAKPLMRLLGVGATARASVYVYNDESDIDILADAIEATGNFFAF